MCHEDSSVEDEERVEDGEGEEELVEEALLHHGRDRHERHDVAKEASEANNADGNPGKPESVILRLNSNLYEVCTEESHNIFFADFW